MSSVLLTIIAGTRIEQACEDAQRVADLLGVSCEFKFNGVSCFAEPNGSPTALAENQQAEQNRPSRGKYDYRFASSRLARSTPEDAAL